MSVVRKRPQARVL
uniref:Uncharacterized protein n=1 Tax=Anguilla anguilla TaxID=7936 RepID=A0A0E9V7W4_ANGAN